MESFLGIVSTFGILSSFLPLILEWDLWNKEKVLLSILSLDFKFSLVSAIALSIPMSADFILDIISSKRGKHAGHLSRIINYLPLAVLIFSLIVPDAIIFFIAIPFELTEFTICIIQARNIACAYAVQSHLCDAGSAIFRTPSFIIVSICYSLSMFFLNISAFKTRFQSGLYFALTTYMESIFTLIITISHGRINHAAMLNAQQIVKDIKDSCETSRDILTDLLDYEKLEAGIMELDRTLIPAMDFITSAIQPFHMQARQSDISLQAISADNLERNIDIHYSIKTENNEKSNKLVCAINNPSPNIIQNNIDSNNNSNTKKNDSRKSLYLVSNDVKESSNCVKSRNDEIMVSSQVEEINDSLNSLEAKEELDNNPTFIELRKSPVKSRKSERSQHQLSQSPDHFRCQSRGLINFHNFKIFKINGLNVGSHDAFAPPANEPF
eukprot:gene2785-5485_t